MSSDRLRAANERDDPPSLLITFILIFVGLAIARFRRWRADRMGVRPLRCRQCNNFQYGEFADWCEECGYSIHIEAHR